MKINLLLLLLIVFFYLGRTYLPYILQLPINTFKITHHNTELESLKSIGLSEKYLIKDYESRFLKLEGRR